MKNRICKKCGKELDEDYKKKKCENCLIKASNKFKNVLKGVGIGVSAICLIVGLNKKEQHNIKNGVK